MIYDFYATCAKGLETLIREELIELGADQVKEHIGGVAFEGELKVAYQACLWSRFSNHILLSLGEFSAVELPQDLYDAITSIDWDQHFDTDNTFKIDVTGVHPTMNNTQFIAQKAKDAIVDQFRDRYQQRPDVNGDTPDITIKIHTNQHKVKVFLSLSGDSLHRRGYRLQQGSAPLKETLAAAILYRAGWAKQVADNPNAVFLDPMCGSGTLVIEAAMIAHNVAPGSLRLFFGFEAWKKHDADVWYQIKADAQTAQRPFSGVILGIDIDPKMVEMVQENSANAKVTDWVSIQKGDATKVSFEYPNGLIVTNPPYGERLMPSEKERLMQLFDQWGENLYQNYQGWELALFTSNVDSARALSFRSHRQNKFYNGAIEAVMYRYHISEATRFKHETVAQKLARKAENEVESDDQHLSFANRLKKNLKQLKPWLKQNQLEAYRVYDADLPDYALAIDIYADHAHIQEYQAGKTVDPVNAEKRLYQAIYHINAVLMIDYANIHIKVRQRQKGKQQYQKQDDQSEYFEISENGAKYWVNFEDYLDTGLFIDHRKMRKLVADASRGKMMLNLFAYTCTASVLAGLYGAKKTTSVDMSKTYLEWGKNNFVLNDLALRNHEFVQADCLQWLKLNRSTFDVIFLDPPTFSNSKRMTDTLDVQRDHVELIELAMKALNKGGVLYFSNNYRKFKMDEVVPYKYDCEQIDDQCLSRDFLRNKNIHHCFVIRHKSK